MAGYMRKPAGGGRKPKLNRSGQPVSPRRRRLPATPGVGGKRSLPGYKKRGATRRPLRAR